MTPNSLANDGSAPSTELLRASLRPSGIDMRCVSPQDMDFLRDLYASARWDELSPTGWPDESKHAFLTQQWNAQRQYYGKHYAQADDLVIAHHQAGRVGRLCVDWGADIRLVDIALIAACRGRGLGTQLLQALCAQADRMQRSIVAHVETFNPARRLYARLGFAVEDSNQIHLRLRRTATALETTP